MFVSPKRNEQEGGAKIPEILLEAGNKGNNRKRFAPPLTQQKTPVIAPRGHVLGHRAQCMWCNRCATALLKPQHAIIFCQLRLVVSQDLKLLLLVHRQECRLKQDCCSCFAVILTTSPICENQLAILDRVHRMDTADQ